MRMLAAFLLLSTPALPDEVDQDKAALLAALKEGNRKGADRAAAALVSHQDIRSAPALASVLGSGITSLKRLERDLEKLRKEMDRHQLRRDDKGNRSGNIVKWREAKFKYDPLLAKVMSMDAVLSHSATHLFKLNTPEAAKGLARVVEGGYHWYARAYAADALGRIDDPISLETLLAEAKKASQKPSIQVALADGLAPKTAKSEEAREIMVKWLDSSYWQVRLSAARALSVCGVKERTYDLINQMARENGRMIDEFNTCLQKLTGVNKRTYGAWKEWWDKNRDAFLEGTYSARATERPDARGLSAFFGVPLVSERVVFVLDVSSSMLRQIAWKPEQGGPGPEGDRTIDVAKYELRNIIQRLPGTARFNLVLMRHFPESLSEGMIKASRTTQKRAEKYVEAIKVEPGTNIWGALQRCLEFAGGRWDDPIRSDSIDTIYLVSDGEHTGRVVTRNEIAQRIVDSLRYKKIAIHAIGTNAPSYGAKLLKDLSEGTGGTYSPR